MNARQLIEAETPKQALRYIKRPKEQFTVGEEFGHATSDAKSVIEAGLEALRTVDRAKYEETMSGEVGDYLRGDNPEDFDPDYFACERLFDMLNPYCPPFTYFGFYEADGSIGCWPWDSMSLEDYEAMHPDKLTYEGPVDFTGVESTYIVAVNENGRKECWDVASRKMLWQW